MASPDEVPTVTDEGSQLLKELTGDDKCEIDPDDPKEPLIDTVQNRLEDLLSKQNLAEDAFIQQHMNAQLYIPLAVLARHHSIRSLGDEATVLAAAKAAAQRSEKIGVDEDGDMVRPLLKARRNTIILHDLPEDFPEEELKTLFNSSPESENFTSLKPDVNNTAFASFKTEEAAQNVAVWLRSQKLQGAEIKCAMKSEHFVRSFYPASAGPSIQASSPYIGPQYAPWAPVHSSWPAKGEHFADPAGWGNSTASWNSAQNNGGMGFYPQDGMSDSMGKNQKGKGGGRKRGALGGSFHNSPSIGEMSQMESGSSYPNSPMLGAVPTDGETEGLLEPGYTHEYRKYSRQYIIEVCNAMDDIVKPESYEKCEQNDVALFRSSPCKDWAPLPTPMAPFASNFFDDRRGTEAAEGDGEGKGKGEWAARKAAWGNNKGHKGSRTEGHDHEESDWSHGDSWQKGGKGRPHAGSWGWGADENWKGSGTYEQPKWKKKEDKTEEKADEEATEGEESAPRKMSWADKVKAAAATPEHRPKWKAKNNDKWKGDEATNFEKDAVGASPELVAAAAAPSHKEEAAPTAKPDAAKADEAPVAKAAPTSPLSWADKARAAANK